MGYLALTIRAFSGGGATARLMRWLLLACVIVPIASDRIINLAERLGRIRSDTVDLVHAVVLTAILAAIVVEVGRMLQTIEDRGRSAQELRQLQIDRMPIACITVAPDLTVRSWNAAAERIFGYSATEAIGRSAVQIILPSGRMTVALYTVWCSLLQGNNNAHSIHENVTKDGRTIVCRWSNTPLLDDNHTVNGVLCMAEDITEAEHAEKARQRSEQRLREVMNSLPHYIFSVDNEDRYLAMNSAACELFGRSEKEIVGRTAEELGIRVALAREWTDHNAKTRAAGAPQPFDTTFVVGDSVRSVHCITSPLRDDGGNVIGVTGIGIDTTEQQATKATTQRLLRAIEQLDEVMFITDRDGVITYVNPAFERVYGYSRSEAVGKTPRILKDDQRSREEYARFWSDLLQGKSVRTEYKNRRKDGTLVDVIASASPVMDERGLISGFIAVQQDLTEQKRGAEERQQLDQRLSSLAKMEALGTLAGGIAHDFNNILAIISTHASLLGRWTEPARVANVADTIKRAVQRGAALSRQILTFARRTELKQETLNVSSLLLELGSMISETMPRAIKLSIETDPAVPAMVGDAGQIHQAMLNLCLNACDVMENGGELRIESGIVPASIIKLLFHDAQSVDYVRIVVADTGSGMDDATRRRIFEPFFTTKPKGKGTGLGLAVVYGVVKSHDGFIDVESEPGRGTEFRLYFPLGAPSSPTLSEEPSELSEGSETLLLVDDEAAILDGLRFQLEDHGYRVHAAANGPTAIELCRQEGVPDAVIMDLGMPKMTAVDLLKSLREVAPGVPVLAMTGYLDPAMHASIIAAGVRQILQKPFRIDQLLHSVRGILDSNPPIETVA